MTNLNKAFSLILLLFLLVSCGNDPKPNFTLKGKIKGLKKGVVYLQKDGDSSVINLDSVAIKGQTEFTLNTNIEEPILLYLKLDKGDNQDYYIPFFGDKGITEINTTLKNLNFDAEIKGAKQQKLLSEFTKIMSQFNNQNLELIQDSYLAQKANDSLKFGSLIKKSDKLLKRKYSYTIQFAMNNKDSEIAPYLALYEMPNANPVYIDSVYNNLTDPIKDSFYGKKLAQVISERKSAE